MCRYVCDCRHVRVAARMQILPMASAEQRKHQYNFNPFRRTTAKHKWKHECTHAATHTHTNTWMRYVKEPSVNSTCLPLTAQHGRIFERLFQSFRNAFKRNGGSRGD